MDITLLEAAQVLLDDLDGLGTFELVGQINPISIKNLRAAIDSELKKKKRRS